MTATNSVGTCASGRRGLRGALFTQGNFHMTFALINQESLEWQRRLEPVKDDMEAAIASLAGPPYEPREVGFALPDFIDIVLNAGDSRSALGATIGQSLPNWGPVAESGGRTVAMTNLYTDPDSEAVLMEQARALLCKFVGRPASTRRRDS